MLEFRRSEERGFADHGWLKTRHSFSFADYHDPAWHHFGPLRVINEDWVGPAAGFGRHPHRNMEILTYIISGALSHRDSMGNGSVIQAGEMQYMSAGTGVEHSEFNHDPEQPVHLLQIWIQPDQMDQPPRYGQQSFDLVSHPNAWQLLAAPQTHQNALVIRQDAYLRACHLKDAALVEITSRATRNGYVHVVTGSLDLNTIPMQQGDAALCGAQPASVLAKDQVLTLKAGPEGATVLWFDLADV